MSMLIRTPGSERGSVRRGETGDAPAQFLWEGRLYLVRAVLGHSTGDGMEEWRVWAAAGQDATPRAFRLRFDWSDGTWTIEPEPPYTGRHRAGGPA
jgi:hypothetical protein